MDTWLIPANERHGPMSEQNPEDPSELEPTLEGQEPPVEGDQPDGGTDPQPDPDVATGDPEPNAEPEDPNAVKAVADSGHPDAANAEPYAGTVTTAGVPLTELGGQPDHLQQTEEVQKGYHGELPGGDDREDLTLAGAVQRFRRLKDEKTRHQDAGTYQG